MAANRWRLEGQLALVTGASAGIGLAITRELLGFGADVLMVARDADALQDARQDLAEEFPEREISVLAADVARSVVPALLTADVRRCLRTAPPLREDDRYVLSCVPYLFYFGRVDGQWRWMEFAADGEG